MYSAAVSKETFLFHTTRAVQKKSPIKWADFQSALSVTAIDPAPVSHLPLSFDKYREMANQSIGSIVYLQK